MFDNWHWSWKKLFYQQVRNFMVFEFSGNRDEYGVAIVNHIKGQRETVFPGLVGLHYNENMFTVAESEHSIKDQPRNIKINQIEIRARENRIRNRKAANQ